MIKKLSLDLADNFNPLQMLNIPGQPEGNWGWNDEYWRYFWQGYGKKYKTSKNDCR